MDITVYVPCHNGESTLPAVLQALRAQTRPAEQYLLVNDRSTDRTVEIARQFSFELHETGPVDFGLAAGRNVALAAARGEILLGLDADAVAEPNLLAEVERQFTSHPEIVGLCGCLQEKYREETIYDLWRSIHMRQHYGPVEVADPPILFGSSSAHRTAMLRQLGGWNPEFKTNFEDTDLTQRIRAAGGRTLYAPTCQLWHLRRDTLASILKGFWNWNYPPAAIHGIYDSYERWRQQRLPWIWHDYRLRRLQDQAAPQIAVITCLLPWSMMIRDLHQIGLRSGQVLELSAVAAIAERVFARYGAQRAIASWLRNWLTTEVIGSLAVSGRFAAWDAGLLEEIETSALASIPDANYWGAVQSPFSVAA